THQTIAAPHEWLKPPLRPSKPPPPANQAHQKLQRPMPQDARTRQHRAGAALQTKSLEIFEKTPEPTSPPTMGNTVPTCVGTPMLAGIRAGSSTPSPSQMLVQGTQWLMRWCVRYVVTPR